MPLNGLHADICVLRIGAVQAKRVYIFVQWKFVWKKIKMNVTSAYIELCVTGKRYHSIELADSFLLKYRLLQTSQLALYERSFERPASLSGVQLTQIALEPISEDLESKKIPVESQVCGSASEELKV